MVFVKIHVVPKGQAEFVTNMASWFYAGQEPLKQPLKQFLKRQIVRIATLMKTSFLTVDCLSNHKNERHQVPRRKNFAFIFIFSEDMAQTR